MPGIAFGAGEGGNPVGGRPFIRGYDAQASTFLDGMRDIGAPSREMFNIESVEVTSGPAGANGGVGPRSTHTRDDNLVNYQLGMVYKPAENASVYLSYGTSSTAAGAVVGQGSEPSGIAPTSAGSALPPRRHFQRQPALLSRGGSPPWRAGAARASACIPIPQPPTCNVFATDAMHVCLD